MNTSIGHCSLYLEYMMWQGQTVDGMGSGVHNYTDYGQAWRLFIEDSFNISGSFINDNESGINIQLDPGSYIYSFAGDCWESGQEKRHYGALFLRVYNDETLETGYLGIFAPMDTLWTYNGQGGVQGPGVFDDAEASYSDSQYKITITNYLYSKDGILGYQDWVSPYSTDPNGRTGLCWSRQFQC